MFPHFPSKSEPCYLCPSSLGMIQYLCPLTESSKLSYKLSNYYTVIKGGYTFLFRINANDLNFGEHHRTRFVVFFFTMLFQISFPVLVV